jgi:hypothetical protein
MVRTSAETGATGAEALVLQDVLRSSPAWPWGNPLTGDPLTRADDKAFGGLRGQPVRLARVLKTIRDEGTRREIRRRAERRCQVLERQVTDARATGLSCLTSYAERELADQRLLVLHIGSLS